MSNKPSKSSKPGKPNFAQIIAKYGLTVPTCGYAPGILQVFYLHGGLSLERTIELFGSLADYAIDGSGSGPSLFLRKI